MGVSIHDLLDTLNKAGANTQGSAFDMSQAIPGLKQNLGNVVQQQDTVIPSLRDNYHSQLSQLAAMDQKLAGVYGDPKSNLFIEHAGARQNAISGAANTGYKAASGIASAAKSRQSELDSQVSDALQLFQQLTSVQTKEEALAKKAAAAAKKAGGKSKKSLADKVAESRARSQEVEQQRLQLAGISPDNKQAADVFLNQFPVKAQEQWIREGQSDEQGRLSDPKSEDLKGYLEYWNKTFKPKKPSAKSDKMDQLKQALGL
jgi:hypothetical protein